MPSFSSLFPVPPGVSTISLGRPPLTPGLDDLPLYAQLLEADRGAAFGVSFSRGLVVTASWSSTTGQ